MSDIRHLAQRVLDLDAQATDRVWIPWITRDADEDNEWIATSSCHTSDEAQARRDAALIAEYRTVAPALARALLAALDENARLRALVQQWLKPMVDRQITTLDAIGNDDVIEDLETTITLSPEQWRLLAGRIALAAPPKEGT